MATQLCFNPFAFAAEVSVRVRAPQFPLIDSLGLSADAVERPESGLHAVIIEVDARTIRIKIFLFTAIIIQLSGLGLSTIS